MGRKQFWGLVLVFGTLVTASRLPLAPRHLFSFDEVNFAWALREFDPRQSQPQPPGYPLFVLQMRVLDWLGFERPETILLVLSLAASAAAVAALAALGARLLGAGAGALGAWLLLFHHSFWFGGLTSALRVQLALVSVIVAWACWRAWRGEIHWAYGSAAALGVGAGIRPELGLVLFPLWVASLLRPGGWGRSAWLARLRALGLLAAVVLAWLAPTMMASGGPAAYLRMCWGYLEYQSVLTSGLFGAAEHHWGRTIVWLLVWTFSGALVWPLLAALGWRREGGFGIGWERSLFLALWLAPAFLFSSLVHIADAGHALAMVPAACLVGGHLTARAIDRLHPWIGREHALIVLLLPSLCVNALVFLGRVESPKAAGPANAALRVWADVYDGMDMSSLWYVRRVARVDRLALEKLRALSTGETIMLWERGLASWRKAAYYYPRLPVIVLSPKRLEEGAAPVARKFLGPRLEQWWDAPAPLRIPLPAGSRLVWMVDPATDFFRALRASFPLQHTDPLYYHDLPAQSGERQVGGYLFTW